VPTQKIENNLVLLLNAKHVKEMMLLPSEMEPVNAIASSVDQVRFVKTVNALLLLFDELIFSPFLFYFIFFSFQFL
jgi:hypothetical protein